MKTYKKWTKSEKRLHEYLKKGDYIDEEMYDYFMSVLPPIKWSFHGFLVGEPYSSNSDGESTYDSFYYIGMQYIYGGLKTIREFTEKAGV